MDTIDPKRLRELRRSRGLSRRALAEMTEVSARQLGRLETGKAVVRVQDDTMWKLTGAFGVAAAVLRGDAPVPPQAAQGPQIDGDCLRAVRKARGMSRDELAEASGVSKPTLTRWESSGRRRVHAANLKAVAGTLHVDESILTGRGRSPTAQPPDAAMPAGRVTPQLRLAFDLVERRYGPSMDEVVELAPLMFVLLAEGSLARRRERLAEAEAAMGRMEELAREQPELYFLKYLGLVQDGYWQEHRSIADRDLRGDAMREDSHWQLSFQEDDLGAVTPFADYLCHLADDMAGRVDFVLGEVDYEVIVGSEDPVCWGAEPYQVCRDDVNELCGESRHARWALAYGDVRLPQIPAGLLEPDAAEARIRWLEERLSDATQARQEEYEEWIKSLVASIDDIGLESKESPDTDASANDAEDGS